jgi:hypothetical protein
LTWTRTGDNAATYPDLMKIYGMEGTDERTVNELSGWLFRCAFQVAAHKTDYEVDMGTAHMLANGRGQVLIDLSVRAGLVTLEERDGLKYLLIKQDPEFIHIPTRAELAFAAQRNSDRRNTRLIVQVLQRDGDQCRWCGILVHWTGSTTDRKGEWDHLDPTQPETTKDLLVVSCLRCNRGRGVDREAWDSSHELRTPPEHPIFGKHTAKRLTDNGHPTEANHRSDDSKAPAGADTARPRAVRSATPAASPSTRVAPAAAGTAPSTRATSSATTPPKVVPESSGTVRNPQSVKSELAGSGRDGMGLPQVSPGAGEGDGTALPTARKKRRRGKRGRKISTTALTTTQTTDLEELGEAS